MADPWAAEAGPIEIPEDLLAWIKPELEPGERLLWVSRADRGAAPRSWRGHRAGAAWAAGWLAVGLASIVGSFRSPAWARQAETGLSSTGIIFGAVGMLIGFGTLVSLVAEVRERRLLGRRVYALTDRRAILWSPVAGSEAVTVHVYPRGSIRPEQIERTQFPDGGGTLAILGGFSIHGKFEGIADVRRVEELVRRFLVAPGPGPAP